MKYTINLRTNNRRIADELHKDFYPVDQEKILTPEEEPSYQLTDGKLEIKEAIQEGNSTDTIMKSL